MIEHSFLYLICACLFGLVMTWGVGANDLANVMSTTMGSKSISIKQALIIAIVFEFTGAFLGSSGVSATMQDGIINLQLLTDTPYVLIYGMLSVLLASMIWMNLASYLGLPVSITNTVVGSIVGFGVIVVGVHAVHWGQVGLIALSWVLAPAIAGAIAFILFFHIQRTILASDEPLKRADKYIPVYLFIVGLVLSSITLLKGLRHFNIVLGYQYDVVLSILVGLSVTLIGKFIFRRIRRDELARERQLVFAQIEKMFGVLVGFTACAMVFAHGSNDVAVAVGPITIILAMLHHISNLQYAHTVPSWVLLLGCTGVVLGLFMYGRKIIETVGESITTLTPSRAFAATLAAATTVVMSTSTGIPISATQTLVGGVLGVGLARGIDALNLTVIRNIFTSWVITIPVASGLTILFYYFLQGFFWVLS